MRSASKHKLISRDFAICALIVLVSVLLHSLSLPLLYADAGARDEYRTDSGLPYLSEMDSYLYCRLTEDLATGDISEYTLRHSRGDDPYISANATGEEGDVVMGLPILGATVYKLLSWIPGVTPYSVIYWLAPFLASLTAIPVYLFASRRLRGLARWRAASGSAAGSDAAARAGRLGGFVAALLVVTAASFSWHTHAGFYDTDMGLALLPCTFLLCYAEALLSKNWKHQLAWGCGSGLALCALSTFWRAYYAYFCIGAAAAGCTIVALLLARLIRKMRLHKQENASASNDDNIASAKTSEGETTSSTEISDEAPSAPAETSRSRLFPGALSGALIGLGAQVLLCLLVRGLEFFKDIAGIIGNVSGSLANGDSAFPDAGRFVSELLPTPLLADDYGNSTLDKALNGFAAYADGMLNKLGAWPVLLVTVITAGFLVYWGCRIVFTGKAFGNKTEVRLSSAAISENLLITAVFLWVWLGCGIIIMLKGSRFLTIPVLPVSIVCGLGTGLLCRYLMRADRAEDTENADQPEPDEHSARTPRPIIRTIIYAGIIALSAAGWAFALRAEFGWTPCLIAGVAALSAGLLLYFTKKRALVNLLALTLVLSPCMACAGGSYSAIPDGSDTLQEMCDAIREQTEPDAVIASWWDYGYFYEYAAKRLTLGDGGNFNGEWNYWLGQALLTDDILLTKGICRMLATGGLDATHLLMDCYKENGADYARRATDVLKTILPLYRQEAEAYLTGVNLAEEPPDNACVVSANLPDSPIDPADRLDAATAAKLLALTHPEEPRPVYLVFSEDMLRKVGAIATFGRWDFSGQNPSTPYIRQGRNAVTVEAGQSAELTFSDSDYMLHLERDVNGQFKGTLRNPKGDQYPMTLRVVPLDGSADATDDWLPCFKFRDNSAYYTVYLREDSPSVYRAILCDTYASDSVIVRGFAMNGETLFYRSVYELPDTNGTTSLREVSVWKIGE